MLIKPITSRDNPTYQSLLAYATDARARRKAGKTVLDGIHLCQAYWQSGGRPLLCAVGEGFVQHPEVAPLLAQCEAAGVPVVSLSSGLFRAVAQVEHGVEMVWMIAIPETPPLPQLSTSSVLLDQVQDPGNVGSILRSAAAAHVQAMYCATSTAALWSPKVLRAAMGAHFALQLYEHVDLDALILQATVPVLATSSYASTNLYACDLRAPVAWLFGHEGQGVSSRLLERATQGVHIPQSPHVESLNVAACAAVCLFEQVRQQGFLAVTA